MRTRTGLAGATFLILGLGAGSATAQLLLRGSDTLEDVTKDAIAAAGLGAQITYVGGGSGAGENAMIAGSQFIAPMSRELNSGTADAVKCQANAHELLVGLDGISIVAASQRNTGDSTNSSASTADDCTDNISGVTVGSAAAPIMKADGVTPCDTTDGCSPAGVYTFANFKEVLAMVYGGLNHTSASGSAVFAAGGVACTYSIDQTTTPATEPAAGTAGCTAPDACFANGKCGTPGTVGTRNAARVNCMNPVRVFLANNYGSIFQDNGTPNSCRTGTCTTLRHAFRRDDLSGTTDAFVGLVGLPSIANPTKSFRLNSPVADRQAAANPFCNAGDRPMNKGDSDYLDLDPIRRAVDFAGAPNRFGAEQVAEYNNDSGVQFSGNNDDTSCNVTGVLPQDHSSPVSALWPDPNGAGATANRVSVLNELGSDGIGPKYNLDTPTTTTRRCLGMVLPITLPATFNTAQDAYFGDTATGAPVICDQTGTAMAFVIPDGRHSQALCPNGGRQPCALPYHADVNAPNGLNFNCLSDKLNPTLPQFGYFDRRIFNLHPVGQDGHYKVDNYVNPNLCNENSTSAFCTTVVAALGTPPPQFTTANQARVVSGYYRLHATKNTALHGSVPTIDKCATFSSTDQIGCLVKASSCSIGYAGREAIDDWAIIGSGNIKNFGFQIGGLAPSTTNVQNFATHAGAIYGLARGLWLNTLGAVANPPMSAAELSLWNWEATPANIDPIITARNFTVVPASVSRVKTCPATFP